MHIFSVLAVVLGPQLVSDLNLSNSFAYTTAVDVCNNLKQL